ncbi:hypothetical protein JMJ58_03710 [Haloterrigena salifodinae]|uniref:Uncharacterized protein n=1 Tax=Haloterrigena salifodinae TaxID=2675099 RepID=A0A8T8E2D0_9EURY|nr:hypothetical protein [Haloterrigena salifodinae]QRV16015.1 hypothetical protein JMJ58_03710 [Haloterrigena salifodinae]
MTTTNQTPDGRTDYEKLLNADEYDSLYHELDEEDTVIDVRAGDAPDRNLVDKRHKFIVAEVGDLGYLVRYDSPVDSRTEFCSDLESYPLADCAADFLGEAVSWHIENKNSTFGDTVEITTDESGISQDIVDQTRAAVDHFTLS